MSVTLTRVFILMLIQILLWYIGAILNAHALLFTLNGLLNNNFFHDSNAAAKMAGLRKSLV